MFDVLDGTIQQDTHIAGCVFIVSLVCGTWGLSPIYSLSLACLIKVLNQGIVGCNYPYNVPLWEIPI